MMIRPQLILFNRSFTTAERAGCIFFGECDFKMKNAVDFENLNVFDFIIGKIEGRYDKMFMSH